MADNFPFPGDFDPERLQEFLQNMMNEGGLEGIDLQALNIDPSAFRAIFQQMQGAAGDPWEQAERQALHIANKDSQGISAGGDSSLADAFGLANLWLGAATTISELAELPKPMTRGEWVTQTMPAWQEIATPVSTSIADALMTTAGEHVPEEMRSFVDGAGEMLRTLSTTMFAGQLGQIVGKLSLEVVTGGDVSIPVLPAGTAAVIPQNFAQFGEGLEIPEDQIALYLATRELAYARLYRHAKWLRLHVMTQIAEFARGVNIDVSKIEQIADGLDPSNPEELRAAIEGGALIPEHTEAQKEALTRLENLVATIDGWVEVVSLSALERLPEAVRLTEAFRRRRAAGGPAEDALAALVGLKLQPRRLREATAMWQAVTDAVGIADRDALWDYPDLMPQASDIDDPAALVERMQARARGEAPQRDEMDEELDKLLRGETGGDANSDEGGTDDSGNGTGGETPV